MLLIFVFLLLLLVAIAVPVVIIVVMVVVLLIIQGFGLESRVLLTVKSTLEPCYAKNNLRTGEAESFWRLLQIQNSCLSAPRPGNQNLHSIKIPWWFEYTLQFENHWSSTSFCCCQLTQFIIADSFHTSVLNLF